jgi:hypothetical protein
MASHTASAAYRIGLWGRLPLPQLRRDLALPARKRELASVVMQFHHKKQVELRQNGSPNQDST